MILFWILAGTMTVAALLFIVPPLVRGGPVRGDGRGAALSVYRDQLRELDADVQAGTIGVDQLRQGREELERRMLDEVTAADVVPLEAAVDGGRWSRRMLAAALVVVVPTSAVLAYFALGEPGAIVPAPVVQAGGHDVTGDQMSGMVERLAARLKEHPDDPQGWYLLARSYAAFDRVEDSLQAYARAAALAPDDPQLLADYADTLAIATGGKLTDRSMELVQAALKLDPKHQKALSLAGSAAFESRDYATAIGYWQRLRATFPDGSDGALGAEANIAQARAAASGGAQGGTEDRGAGDAPIAAAPVAATIAGTVMLSPALADKAMPSDTVFIFARATSGPKMPLAILKVQVKDLPRAFTLDNSMAMAPAARLSNFAEVTVGARVSKSGNAAPEPGDLAGSVAGVKVGSGDVRVEIDRVVE